MANYIAICTTNWWENNADQAKYVAQYPSLSAWATDRANSSITLTAPEIVEIQGDDWQSAGYDTADRITINATTTTENYIEITAIGLARHLGVWDDTRYIFKPTSSSNMILINTNTKNITIHGLQIDVVGEGNYRAIALEEKLTSRTSIIHSNIFKLSSAGSSNSTSCAVILRSTAAGSAFYNNILWSAYDSAPQGIRCNYAHPVIYNNTIYGFDKGVYGGGHLKNNLVVGCTTPFDSIDSADYNAYDTGLDPGTNGIDISGTVPSDFFTDYINGDFSLLNSAISLRQKGINLTNDSVAPFDFDIAGQTRFAEPDAWDIGAWHYSGAAVGDLVKVKILNAVPGTMILVEVDADGSPVAAPFSITGSSIDIDYEYFEDTLLLLRARKSSAGDVTRYLPLDMNALATNKGCTFYLSQVEDIIAQ